MARVLPHNQDKKIEYLWQGRHTKNDPNVAFHGFGEMAFNYPADSAGKINRGDGRFWSVDENTKKAVLKPIQLKRIHVQAEIDTMCKGTEAEIETLVKQTLGNW